jgi:dTDP-L-rhamnose 4-epimerase
MHRELGWRAEVGFAEGMAEFARAGLRASGRMTGSPGLKGW